MNALKVEISVIGKILSLIPRLNSPSHDRFQEIMNLTLVLSS